MKLLQSDRKVPSTDPTSSWTPLSLPLVFVLSLCLFLTSYSFGSHPSRTFPHLSPSLCCLSPTLFFTSVPSSWSLLPSFPFLTPPAPHPLRPRTSLSSTFGSRQSSRCPEGRFLCQEGREECQTFTKCPFETISFTLDPSTLVFRHQGSYWTTEVGYIGVVSCHTELAGTTRTWTLPLHF